MIYTTVFVVVVSITVVIGLCYSIFYPLNQIARRQQHEYRHNYSPLPCYRDCMFCNDDPKSLRARKW